MELASTSLICSLEPATGGAHRPSMIPEMTDPTEVRSLARFTKVSNEVVEALRATGYLSFRDLHVRVAGGLAVLRGRVPSYYLKQKAQAVTLSISGVDEVLNELEVAPG